MPHFYKDLSTMTAGTEEELIAGVAGRRIMIRSLAISVSVNTEVLLLDGDGGDIIMRGLGVNANQPFVLPDNSRGWNSLGTAGEDVYLDVADSQTGVGVQVSGEYELVN